MFIPYIQCSLVFVFFLHFSCIEDSKEVCALKYTKLNVNASYISMDKITVELSLLLFENKIHPTKSGSPSLSHSALD